MPSPACRFSLHYLEPALPRLKSSAMGRRDFPHLGIFLHPVTRLPTRRVSFRRRFPFLLPCGQSHPFSSEVLSSGPTPPVGPLASRPPVAFLLNLCSLARSLAVLSLLLCGSSSLLLSHCHWAVISGITVWRPRMTTLCYPSLSAAPQHHHRGVTRCWGLGCTNDGMGRSEGRGHLRRS